MQELTSSYVVNEGAEDEAPLHAAPLYSFDFTEPASGLANASVIDQAVSILLSKYEVRTYHWHSLACPNLTQCVFCM